ncbi:DNA processing protein DprA [Cryobacterium sp. MLB-32]|uniref:DNA processing protein DprA n=1 Tax=Cryobacterium sp. MLB-32 TaxID=1529318 RepID=UPI0006902219|nr:DNA processing protein DprA [Cryobacterium sp. MLB-32]
MSIAAVTETISTAHNIRMTPDTIARAAWATITTPGDPRAGQLITQLGAEQALAETLTGTTPTVAGVNMPYLRAAVLPEYSALKVSDVLSESVERGFTILTPSHPLWPTPVAGLGSAAPFALWVRGDNALLSTRTVVLTGTRNATGYGRHVCIDLASGLAERGYVIASGASHGIDVAALTSARASANTPVALLAGGVDQPVPAESVDLLADIAEHGAIVSELPPGSAPSTWSFVRRNQLLAALGTKAVIVEAEYDCAALSVATTALDLARPCGAIPGLAMSTTSAGCHRLIRDFGAQLVTSIDDVDDLI